MHARFGSFDVTLVDGRYVLVVDTDDEGDILDGAIRCLESSRDSAYFEKFQRQLWDESYPLDASSDG